MDNLMKDVYDLIEYMFSFGWIFGYTVATIVCYYNCVKPFRKLLKGEL